MDRVKGIAKNGYHPTGKDGGKESWRGDHKGINQVASWVGKGKNTNDLQSAKEHNSRPLTSLKDPDSFGPPPKNTNYYGGSPTTSSPTSAVSSSRHGLGSPISTDTTRAQSQERNEAPPKPAPPALPYRANRTGINTSNIPAPPVRRVAGSSGSASNPPPPASAIKPPKPNLPPRLPPRQNSNPLQSAPIDNPPTYAAATEEQNEWSQQKTAPLPPARHNVFANQDGALSRLGSAGVKVPGLGIGKASPSEEEQHDNPWADEPSGASNPKPTPPNPNPTSLSSLSSRFSNLSTPTPSSPNPSSTPSQPPAPAPSTGGTTWAQKQAALKTASSFHKDPSSVSLSDAKATASTANNFRERHGEQVAQGWKVGNGLNKKYGIADRVGAATGGSGAPKPNAAAEETMGTPGSPAVGGENPWAGVVGGGGGTGTGINRKPPPPPVPLGSKPR